MGFRIRRRTKIIILTLFFVVILSCVAVNRALYPVLVSLSSARAKSVVTQALNDAILASAQEGIGYSELMSVGIDDGKVYLLQTNTQQMNLLAASTVKQALKNLEERGREGFKIPFGTLTGISLLAGAGPEIKATFLPVSGVTTKYRSQFLGAGVNQTLHRIELTLSVTVEIALPTGVASVNVDAGMPIAESVIVGQVPQAFTDVANQEDMLNLIPIEAH